MPKGTKLSADELVFETRNPLWVVSTKLEKIISIYKTGLHENSMINNHGGLSFYPFGEKAEVGSRMYLGFNQPFPEEQPIPITFNLFEEYPISRGSHGGEKPHIIPSALLEWEYYSKKNGGMWVPLPLVMDDTLMLSKSGRLTFRAPKDMQKRQISPANDGERFWIRSTVAQAGYELPPRIDSILLNTISAVQCETHYEEVIGRSNGLPGQSYSLSHYPIIQESLVLQVEEKDGDSSEWKDWFRVDDFDASKPGDRHFVLKAETGEIFFPEGVNGAIPPVPMDGANENIRALVYQSTSGEKGNVGVGRISKIVQATGDLANLSVQNVFPASCGSAQETLEAAQTRARLELNMHFRAVTSEDFEFLAVSTPGLRVSRAKAFPLLAPDYTTKEAAVTVVIVPFSQEEKPIPSQGFLSTVCRHLDQHRLITTQLHVIPPEYVKVNVDAVVLIKQGFNPVITQQKIVETLGRFLNPLEGGFNGGGWPFGRPVFKSEVYAVVEKVSGVECVQSVGLKGEGDGINQDRDGNVLIRQFSLVYSGVHRINIITDQQECR